ncbi:uncharacterized protein ARMOST_14197 [Armillaria ostoyae]|uniref:Uncharacterized protein n=1 Tax=Armillaria ostoyae TaxID=47428 RepID=A0A284RPY6_ARMOS|nr:uncharacterized protein ARMOST_14197 [Armillaria ostoyae]
MIPFECPIPSYTHSAITQLDRDFETGPKYWYKDNPAATLGIPEVSFLKHFEKLFHANKLFEYNTKALPMAVRKIYLNAFSWERL